MAIHVALTHKTSYRYDRPVRLGPQIVRLRPAPHCRTPILSYSLKVSPKTHFLNWQQDPQSNYLARLVFPDPTTEFVIEVDLVVEMAIINPFDFFLEASVEEAPFTYDEAAARELRPYLETEPAGPLLTKFLDDFDRTPRRTIDYLIDLNRKIQSHVGYVIRLEPGIQSCEETLGKALGSCRDSAWLLVQAARHLGLAARFASGYLIQLTADQKSLDGPSGPTSDFTDLHAWAEIYLPGAGWIGLDATSGLLAGEGHIPLACTPDPSSAAPVTGLVEPAEVEFHHFMGVTRVDERPRTTKPYLGDQWLDIEALGHQVDGDLAAGDVRLTMGGEPTFVSIDDMDGAEWNTAAVGPNKRRLAADLIDRLRARFGPGGLLHFGQGKWYPGESLPRWAFTLYWRRDGEPIWASPDHLAKEATVTRFGIAEAGRFALNLAEGLGLAPDLARAAYEDSTHYGDAEAKLPINIAPHDAHSEGEETKDRMARVFGRGVEAAVGYVLPVARDHSRGAPGWKSSLWPLRQEKLRLVPGDSAMGYRLPLGSLPWVAEADYPYVIQQDPYAPRPPLPPHPSMAPAVGVTIARAAGGGEDMSRRVPKLGQSASWIVRTAICIEPRDGRLYIFMPPTGNLEDYLALLHEVEQAALATDLPVFIEGYPPPRDPRLVALGVTPDPGVIEVNIHPAASWSELVRNTKDLYEDARQSRLGTEKFMIDGRHVGTGGGNHIVVGGATPWDSPFLRRPDLLRSLITYWQNHPALSYLFAGLFIGPTSQAPRVDEARHDSLYELEIAFTQIDRAVASGQGCPPWLIDRMLRHLLTDLQGNTHRAEFCIDKLYSPDSATGRLGLVEFRGFEMPPHAEMSLTQQLLLRALIAMFWKQPYKAPLVRWGVELHDRFLLPAFVERDMRDVVEDLRAGGYDFEFEWFRPHLEFRFPRHGAIEQRGVTLEVRHALEPWNTLGEEPAGGGTTRFVDSTVERLQIRVSGMIGERYRVSCNGWLIPMTRIGDAGDYVGGVRYRAWSAPSSLHPTIPPHGPLVFDLVDSWSGRSIGGCTYHVAHPGGRNHTNMPINDHEAEGRRLARFQPFGHTPGPFTPRDPGTSPDFPLTLDLRRV